MITLDLYLMGRDKYYVISHEQVANAQVTVERANSLLMHFGEQRTVTSGWRPPGVNQATPGAALYSKHITCEAVDLEDHDGLLDDWCLDNPEVLERLGLWQEHPSATKGWCHVQIVPPRSGKRCFFP